MRVGWSGDSGWWGGADGFANLHFRLRAETYPATHTFERSPSGRKIMNLSEGPEVRPTHGETVGTTETL